MPGFEQNQGTNLKLKSASRLEAERPEILNSGSTQHLKTLFNESFCLVAPIVFFFNLNPVWEFY